MNTVAKTEVDTIVETYNTPLAELNPAKVERFKADTLWPIFERLRREDPVHFTRLFRQRYGLTPSELRCSGSRSEC